MKRKIYTEKLCTFPFLIKPPTSLEELVPIFFLYIMNMEVVLSCKNVLKEKLEVIRTSKDKIEINKI
jgi:hypothetical protein